MMLAISILVLIAFNLTNSEIDAVRILGNKTIFHGINFGAYTAVSIGAWFLLQVPFEWGEITVFSIAAFTCRQITFDIPLNWRRGLKWDYVSPANPPKAVMDRIEQFIFGKNGRLPVYIYSGTWLLSTAELIWAFYK